MQNPLTAQLALNLRGLKELRVQIKPFPYKRIHLCLSRCASGERTNAAPCLSTPMLRASITPWFELDLGM